MNAAKATAFHDRDREEDIRGASDRFAVAVPEPIWLDPRRATALFAERVEARRRIAASKEQVAANARRELQAERERWVTNRDQRKEDLARIDRMLAAGRKTPRISIATGRECR